MPKLVPYAADPAVLVAAIIEAHVTHWVTVAAAEATYAITITTSDIITMTTTTTMTAIASEGFENSTGDWAAVPVVLAPLLGIMGVAALICVARELLI